VEQINFVCPKCRKSYAMTGHSGQKFNCACGQALEVPQISDKLPLSYDVLTVLFVIAAGIFLCVALASCVRYLI